MALNHAPTLPHELQKSIRSAVERALDEDVGSGDITAALLDRQAFASATIISREPAILCGTAWADEVFRQINPEVRLDWFCQDGDALEPDTPFVRLTGNARSLLTGERTALNFLQTLSGTATETRRIVDLVADLPVRILDTRKTIPGLRLAQKYAVHCGGGHNHRLGLYDAFLIKENHIAACGGIGAAVETARTSVPGKPVEVEVESLDELREALDAGADTIMLDELSLEQMREAVRITDGRAVLEASGGVSPENLRAVAETGIDCISIGALTKHVRAIDLSMRLEVES